MRTIYKYPIPMSGRFSLMIPQGSKILHVDTPFEQPHLWALIDTNAFQITRNFVVLGTGHPAPDGPLEHVGTFLLHQGSLVFHVFEVA